MSAFYISAAHKSSGKTTLSIGLSAAIRRRGLSIQAFKKGPDYIDPIWLSQATGQPCQNLDFFTSSEDYIVNQFQQFGRQHDVVLVEGNMGLFDGLSLDGSDSNAAMTKLLQLPVVLVVDCMGTSRGVAPLLVGYQHFDPQIQYAGVILNKVAGSRHEQKLREVVETHTDFQLLGAVHRNTDIQLTERHLGLIPSNEMPDQSTSVIELLADQVEQFIDVETLLHLQDPPILTGVPSQPEASLSSTPNIRIAVAMDEAFGFYYPGDLQRFRDLGVEIVPFSAITDCQLPENIEGLFIGGGFPEMQVERLSANQTMMTSIHTAISTGLPTYAECGGLMYLCSALEKKGQRYPLCNIIPASVEMSIRPQGRGYVVLETRHNHPWYDLTDNHSSLIRAHEFHYSSLQGLPDNVACAFSMKRGTGIDGVNDGIILHNMVASYAHLRSTDLCSWVDDFVNFVKKHKRCR